MQKLKTFTDTKGWIYSVEIEDVNRTITPNIIAEGVVNAPQLLHKYYSLERAIQFIDSSKVYVSHPSDFNDPVDCSNALINFKNLSKEEFIRILGIIEKPFGGISLDNIDDFFNNNKKRGILIKKAKYWFRNSFYAKLGIFCLCEDFKNYRLWSYYTNHKGIAFSFKTEELNKKMSGPFPVNYRNELEMIDLNVYHDELCKLYQTNVKNDFWKDENEWRFLYRTLNILESPIHYKKDIPNLKSRLIQIDINTIDSVYLGHNFFNDFEIIESGVFDLSYNHSVVRKVIDDREMKFEFIKKTYESNIPIKWIRFHDDLVAEIKEIKINKIEENKVYYN